MATQSLSRTARLFPSVFDDFFKPWNEWFDGNGNGNLELTIPAVNVSENKENFKMELAAPGLKKEDFKVKVENNVLTISAEKQETHEKKDEKMSRREYNYSSFSRSFSLPDAVNADKTEAHYNNGVLTLVLPKKEEAKKSIGGKQIEIK
ncbi:heat shock protein Hsp20 [Chitinophaga jiangningensis]|uniref:Heat shock protein Hsp20 n=1 Tax=Chitinophaga jiangningensis TaxID=1419482 RepID=A0A1M7KCN5_9BACT|nr:Hsp20/alpha crystallin family protein [Chitinophaga jiangningensis]SHM63058.1 heat shock protein Hsp20 [Chitinophaga jiangningensis]